MELSLPLGFSAERAEAVQARARLIRAEAQAAIAKDQHRVGWVNQCREFRLAVRNAAWIQEAFEENRERVRLEEGRFRIGRSNAFQMIQAGDDGANAEIQYRNAEVQKRVAAWKVLKLAGQVEPWLQETLKSTSKQMVISDEGAAR